MSGMSAADERNGQPVEACLQDAASEEISLCKGSDDSLGDVEIETLKETSFTHASANPYLISHKTRPKRKRKATTFDFPPDSRRKVTSDDETSLICSEEMHKESDPPSKTSTGRKERATKPRKNHPPKHRKGDGKDQDDVEKAAEDAAESSLYSEVAGVYTALLRLRKKRELDEIPVVPLPQRTIGGLRDQIEKSKQCNCKRSNCLKLYCECFASGIYCSALCNCFSCRNIEGSGSDERNLAILVTLDRNAHAFRPRIIAVAGAAASVAGAGTPAVHGYKTTARSAVPYNDLVASPGGGGQSSSGCNCKKSFCLKKYCECFHAAVYCKPPHCRCTDCQNTEGNPERERLVAKRRSQAVAAASAAALAHQHSRLAHMSGRMAMMGDAGRSFYGTEHSSAATGEKATDAEASAAAAAMAAGAAAGGVDVFLPPSSYAIPMQLENGTSYSALSFGTAGPRSMGQSTSDASSLSNRRPTQSTTPGSKRQRKKRLPPSFSPLIGRETELEKAWRMEENRVTSVFTGIRQELDKLPMSHETHAGIRNPYNYTTGATLLAEVQMHLHRLVGVWRAAERNCRGRNPSEATHDLLLEKTSMGITEDSPNLVVASVKKADGDAEAYRSDKEVGSQDIVQISSKTNESSSTVDDGKNNADAEKKEDSSCELVCSEEMTCQPGRLPLCAETSRELSILASQDASLIRELAHIVRRKAMELAKDRIRFASEPPVDA